MNGKEIVIATLQHRETPSLAWVPFAGVHAGKVLGYTAPEVLTDRGKLLESLVRVNRLYRPDGQPVVFDLQLEAEILGCDLKWADRNPPSVTSHPLANATEIPDRIPRRDEGRLPIVMETAAALKKQVGGYHGPVRAPVRAPYPRVTPARREPVHGPDQAARVRCRPP